MTEKAKILPLWNQYAFDCPRCERHWAPYQIRLMRHNGSWYCHKCQIELTENRPTGTRGTKVQLNDTQRLDTCHTCSQPFGTRRAVVNIHGHLVHYRCPSAKRNT